MKIGVLGGGQLGRMLALAGIPLDLRFRFLDHNADAPAGQVGELIVGEFDDPNALDRFADGLDLVTYEFENVPVESVRRVAERVKVYPPIEALEQGQDRLLEKRLFNRLEIPTAKYGPIGGTKDFTAAIEMTGVPAILKTRRMGYDGKGQYRLRDAGDIALAWGALEQRQAILEGLVSFERELSIIAARSEMGEIVYYPLVENRHKDGILALTIAPAPRRQKLQETAEVYARRVLEALRYVGVLAIELFESEGRLYANELAPRVHNSGHWTIDGAATSQFENHLRAILGFPLGETTPRGATAMFNLIGRIPRLVDILPVPGARLHLYGKPPRPGRKLGHVNLRADDLEQLSVRMGAFKKWLAARYG